MMNPVEEDRAYAACKHKDKQRSWDAYFMGMAAYVATRSKDPSTHVGAVVVGPDNRIRSTGYNGFPAGVQELSERYESRGLKLGFSEHAERNACFGAARTGVALEGCTIYVHGLKPCADCARAIIQSGIARVVISDDAMPQRWESSMLMGEQMLDEAGVTVDVVKPTDNLDYPQGA